MGEATEGGVDPDPGSPLKADPALPSAGFVLAPGYAWRMAAFFTALFVVAGVKLPYLPVWLDWRGLSGPQIAIVTAAPLFVRILVGPLIAMAADWSGDRRGAAIVLAWASVCGLGLLVSADGFWPILAASFAMALATNGIMPLAETMAMSGVRLGGLDYGRMRLWGSISFIAAGFAGGAALEGLGAGAIVALLAAGTLLTAGLAHALPPEAGTGLGTAGQSGRQTATPAGRRRFSAGDALALATDRQFLVFLLAAGAVQASHAVFYTFGVIQWRAQGIAPVWPAVFWAVGVGVEIALFAVSRSAVERAGPLGLLLAGAAGGILRWTAMAFDPPVAVLLGLQTLHGLTFGAAHLGALHTMALLVPASSSGTAQALYASVTAGIGLGAATVAAGPLYAAYGGRAYLAMALLAGVGLVAGLVLRRLQTRPAKS